MSAVSGTTYLMSLESVYHTDNQVPIAIAGSKLCAQAILDDTKTPYPASYTRTPPRPTSSALDVRHPRALLYRLEDLFSTLLPFLIGAILTLAILLALRVGTGGRVDLFDYLDPRSSLRTTGVGAVQTPRVLSVQEQVIERVSDMAQRVKDGEGAKGVLLGVPAVLMGAGWMRAQRLRGRMGRRLE